MTQKDREQIATGRFHIISPVVNRATPLNPGEVSAWFREATQKTFICIVGHEKRYIQKIIIQFEIVKRATDTQLDLVVEFLFEFSQACTIQVILRLDLNRKNIVSPLDKEVNIIRTDSKRTSIEASLQIDSVKPEVHNFRSMLL